MTSDVSRAIRLKSVLVLFCLAGFIGNGSSVAAQDRSAPEIVWFTVRPGDTLFSISQRFDVRVEQLQRWNNLADARIRAGMKLRVRPPQSSGDEDAERTPTPGAIPLDDRPSEAPAYPDDDVTGTQISSLGGGLAGVPVDAGQTVYSLANRYALSPDTLLALNPDLNTVLTEGMRIIVPEDRVVRQRTVFRGDTLFSIARDEGVSIEALRRLNKLTGSTLRVGQRLQIPSARVDETEMLRLPPAGDYPMRPFPTLLHGRALSKGRVLRPNAFLIGHPSLPVGTIVVVKAGGRYAFAEVAERTVSPDPRFIEGSDALLSALSLRPGNQVSLFAVQ